MRTTTQFAVGLALVVVGAVLVFATGSVESTVPGTAAALGAIGIAGGTLLVGLSEEREQYV